tara:strand:- start:446 stop:1276 length:831 start_codon:yes stop_codon:yes gene_type:complete
MNLFTRVVNSRLNLARVIYKGLWKLVLKTIEYFQFFKVSSKVQNQLFQRVQLDRELGIKKLDGIMLKFFGKSYSENSAGSEHLVLFSSISLKNQKIKKILEIGTFDGRTALILSKLFPESEIVTMDLPQSSDVFKNTYGRNLTSEIFANERNKILSKGANIKFEEADSITLTYKIDNFDLIWVDGSHGYPFIAMDIVNSLRLSRVGGYILIDDIWKTPYKSDKYYKSVGGFESLEALKKANVIDSYFLINKRLGGQYNYPSAKKYVALIRKSNEKC